MSQQKASDRTYGEETRLELPKRHQVKFEAHIQQHQAIFNEMGSLEADERTKARIVPAPAPALQTHTWTIDRKDRLEGVLIVTYRCGPWLAPGEVDTCYGCGETVTNRDVAVYFPDALVGKNIHPYLDLVVAKRRTAA